MNTCLIAVDVQTTTPLDVAAKLFTMFGVVVGLLVFGLGLYQFRIKVTTDGRDLRWRRSEAAMKLLDELFADPVADNALKLIEYGSHDFVATGAIVPVTVTRSQTVAVLGGPSEQVMLPGGSDNPVVDQNSVEVDQAAELIGDSFGKLFFLLSRIHDAGTLDYVAWSDVEGVLRARLQPLLCDEQFVAVVQAFLKREHAYALPALEWLTAAHGKDPLTGLPHKANGRSPLK